MSSALRLNRNIWGVLMDEHSLIQVRYAKDRNQYPGRCLVLMAFGLTGIGFARKRKQL
jgi:hypothetical protein